MNKLVQGFFVSLVLLLLSCGEARQLMYTNLDNSGHLFLSHYTSVIPTLGPCGFFRNSDDYSIATPRVRGRIESQELKIFKFSQDTAKITYAGYIEFAESNRVFVELYEIKNGVRQPLTINGLHKVKVEENKM